MGVRVLVVDDSVVVRRTVTDVLAEADDVQVVGSAADGASGLRGIGELAPDVVTLDVEMPGMNGLETLGRIREQFPTLPVIMYSTLTEGGARATLDALALGAVDYATKPSSATSREDARDHVRATLTPLVRLWGKRRAAPPRAGGAVVRRPTSHAAITVTPSAPIRLVVIGVSTGGPDALATMVPSLPADLSVPVVIVQHMPPVFTEMLAKRLDQLGPLPVREAVDAEVARPGHVYIAPGGRHLAVAAEHGALTLHLNDDDPENSCRPAVDVLFRTAARAAKGRLLAAVLTGMGQDGLIGARLVREAGGHVMTQDEASSVVWGMPGYVTRAGLSEAVLPLDDIGVAIGRAVAAWPATQSWPTEGPARQLERT
jgi:two-component system chemotaxis response regulator CheB